MRLPSDQPIAPAAGDFRRWIRSDMLVLRWVFATLYALLIFGLLMITVVNGDGDATIGMLVVLGALLAGQALLIFGTGTIRLCHPIRKRRLIMPVFVGATMLGVLSAGFLVAMSELFDVNKTISEEFMLGLVAISWIGWGVLLWTTLLDKRRHTILSRITTYLFAGSLAELIASVPAHIIVSRRPGCLVGLGTMIGIMAGVCVMLFSFGPAIVLLFLRPRLRAETTADGSQYCPACGYDLRATPERCPECGLAVET